MSREKRAIKATIRIIEETIKILENNIYPCVTRPAQEILNHKKGALRRTLIGLNEIHRILPCGPERTLVLRRRASSLEEDLVQNFLK